MKRFNGGNQVKGGYYWNMRSWEIATVSEKLGNLPGGADDKFVRVPLPVLLVVAPAMGGAFAIFLPFIGFALPAYALWKKVARTGVPATAKAKAV